MNVFTDKSRSTERLRECITITYGRICSERDTFIETLLQDTSNQRFIRARFFFSLYDRREDECIICSISESPIGGSDLPFEFIEQCRDDTRRIGILTDTKRIWHEKSLERRNSLKKVICVTICVNILCSGEKCATFSDIFTSEIRIDIIEIPSREYRDSVIGMNWLCDTISEKTLDRHTARAVFPYLESHIRRKKSHPKPILERRHLPAKRCIE